MLYLATATNPGAAAWTAMGGIVYAAFNPLFISANAGTPGAQVLTAAGLTIPANTIQADDIILVSCQLIADAQGAALNNGVGFAWEVDGFYNSPSRFIPTPIGSLSFGSFATAVGSYIPTTPALFFNGSIVLDDVFLPATDSAQVRNSQGFQIAPDLSLPLTINPTVDFSVIDAGMTAGVAGLTIQIIRPS